jgi:hypothetical protein
MPAKEKEVRTEKRKCYVDFTCKSDYGKGDRDDDELDKLAIMGS